MGIHKLNCGQHFMMRVSRTITIYTLNLYSALCQLYLNKTRRKNKTKTNKKTQYFTTFSAVSCHLRKSKDSNGVSTAHTNCNMLKRCFFVQMQVLSNAGVISKLSKMLIHMSTSLFLLY